MAQPFYARKIVLNVGPRKGETVYFAQAYYYGVIGTQAVAEQIAEESARTAADVKAVIDRLVYFCKRNMTLGYKIEIDGMGTFFNELLTDGSVDTPEEVDVRLIKRVRPAFKPSYTVSNGGFRYNLLPEKTELARIDFKGVTAQVAEDTMDGLEDGSQGGEDESTTPGGNTGGTPVSPGTGGGEDITGGSGEE